MHADFHARTQEYIIRGPSAMVCFASKKLCLWGGKNGDARQVNFIYMAFIYVCCVSQMSGFEKNLIWSCLHQK